MKVKLLSAISNEWWSIRGILHTYTYIYIAKIIIRVYNIYVYFIQISKSKYLRSWIFDFLQYFFSFYILIRVYTVNKNLWTFKKPFIILREREESV